MNIYLNSGGATLQISLNEKVYSEITELKFLFDYIPDLSIRSEDRNFDGSLTVEEGEDFHFEFSDSRGKLNYSPEKISKHDMVTLFEHILELLREEKGIFCLHGSAISKDSKGLWLLGPVSGLGKTTLALDLCLSRKFKFVGDEKILLSDDLFIKSGIKTINYNKEELFQSIKQNLHGLDKDKLSEVVEVEEDAIPLKVIILPILMNNCSGIEIQKWDEQKASFHVYEELSRKIRGTSRRVGNFSIPIQSLDTPPVARSRSNLANNISKSVPCYLIKGGLNEVEAEVQRLMNSA